MKPLSSSQSDKKKKTLAFEYEFSLSHLFDTSLMQKLNLLNVKQIQSGIGPFTCIHCHSVCLIRALFPMKAIYLRYLPKVTTWH